MSTQVPIEQIQEDLIRFGRAAVRIVEAADTLLSFKPVWTERLLLRLVRALYQHRLRDIVALAPADMTAEILAASEKMTGPVRGLRRIDIQRGAIDDWTVEFCRCILDTC